MPLQAQAGTCSVCAILWVIVVELGQQPVVETTGMRNAPRRWWETPELARDLLTAPEG